jgi:acyl-coenzyme A thioesterase PaaI-like protein
MTTEPDYAFFDNIPWCKILLSDLQFAATPSTCRNVKVSGEDLFFGKTLKTETTIPAYLTTYRLPTTPTSPITDSRTFLALAPELDGYPHVCHGGIQASILDEIMGALLSMVKRREIELARQRGEEVKKVPYVTAELTCKYLRPVVTPGIVCVVVRIVKEEGRKVWVEGAIVDKDGLELCTGLGLLMRPRTKKEKL